MRLDVNGFNSNMIKSLPSFYLTEDRKQDNVLRRYLGSVFIGGTDDILKSINHTEDFIDPFKCPSEDLPALFKSWGLNYEPTLEEGYQRKLLANLGEVYRRKGSYSCVRYLVRSITGRDCDVIYTKTEDGERRLDVTLISDSLGDIVSGEIQRASEAIQKIIPQFLPFYLVPNVSFSSPRGSLDFPVRNKGFRTAERVFSDFTFKGLDNSFLNPDFDLGTEFWECSEDHTLVTSTVKKDSNKCLQSTWKTDSYFYQDFDVHYKDSYSVKAYFMCPTEYYNDPPVVTMLITCYRADGTIIHSILNSEVELNIKNRWDFLKRNIYIDEPLCTRVRLSFHCSVPNQVIYFSCPQLLLKSRVEQLQCADILSVTPDYNGCTVEWSPVMGANEYLIYSVTPKGELTLLNHWNTSNRYIWGNAPLTEEGLKLLVASSNGHITSELDPSKSALYYSRNSVTGNPVQIGDDCLDYPLQSLTLYGNSTQGYASYGGEPLGKNLLDINKFVPIQVEKITINKDNIVVTAGDYIYGIKLLDENLLTVGETYTFSVASVSSYGETKFGWRIAYADDTYANKVDNTLTTTLTIEKPAKGAWFYVRMGETTTEDIIISKPQIEKGDTATEYEPYICNPNPDCPVPIESVGDDGNVSVTACGKNLLPYQKERTVNGITATWTDKGIQLDGSTTNFNCRWEVLPGTKLPTGSYTINGLAGASSTSYQLTVTKNGTLILYVTTNSKTFEVNEGDIVSISLFAYSAYGEYSKIVLPYQLEKGVTATPYEPYRGNTATITSGLPLCGIPVSSNGNYKDCEGQEWVCDKLVINSDGTGKVVKYTSNILLDGSSDETWHLSSAYTRIMSSVAKSTVKGNSDKVGQSKNVMPCLSDQFVAISPYDSYNGISEGVAIDYNGTIALSFADLIGNTDINAWKSRLAENPVTILYQLITPQEIPLSKSEVLELQKYRGMTTVFNDEQAEMTVNYCSNKDFDLGGVALG